MKRGSGSVRILSDLWHNRWFRAGLITLGLVVLPKLALKLAAIQDNIWAETGADTLTTLVAILRMSPLASEALTSVVEKDDKKGF
jgi:hypothetical protein